MKNSEQTIQQVDRAINKIADKFPKVNEPTIFTDIHIRVNQETGELVAYDDDDKEITRVVIEQWINNQDDDFYAEITKLLHKRLDHLKHQVEGMSIIRPNGLTSDVVRMKKMMSRLAMSEKDVRSGLTSPCRFGPMRFTSADSAPYAPTAWPNSAIAPSSRMFHSSTRFWNML